jgi:hypothetical protein
MTAERLALLCAGSYFLVGLLTGIWKYAAIARSPDATAPVYVDVAHRSSLLYAFACILIERMLQVSALSPTVEWYATLAQVVFFGLAISTYVLHGVLKDTDNQLRKPYVLGRHALPGWMIHGFMWALVLGELGGFVVVLYGVAIA